MGLYNEMNKLRITQRTEKNEEIRTHQYKITNTGRPRMPVWTIICCFIFFYTLLSQWEFFTWEIRAHRQRVSTTILTGKNSHNCFVCSWRRRGSNLGSLDLESDALPTEPPRHPMILMIKSHIITPVELDHVPIWVGWDSFCNWSFLGLVSMG